MTDRLEMTSDLIDHVRRQGTQDPASSKKLRWYTQTFAKAVLRAPRKQVQRLLLLINRLNAKRGRELSVFSRTNSRIESNIILKR